MHVCGYVCPPMCVLCVLQALLNERMAPDILQYKEDLVQRIQEGLERQVGVYGVKGRRVWCVARGCAGAV